jgi:hypothetical protein
VARTATQEEKERFLEYVRSGDDRATAAWKVDSELSGTLFRRMCNPNAVTYDEQFAKSYNEAVEQRGPLSPAREHIDSKDRHVPTQNLNGFTKSIYLTDDQLEQFIEKVKAGVMTAEAARQIDPPTSISQINRRASHDVGFADAYRTAKEEGYTAFQENLRAEAVRQAFAGDYRALRDQLLMHVPEAKALMTSRHEVGGVDGGAIRLLAERHFHELPSEMLEQLIAVVEQRELGEQKALPAG